MEDLVLIDSDGIIFADTESHEIRMIRKTKPGEVEKQRYSGEVPKDVIVKLPIVLPEDRMKDDKG